jgi:hypothetical protein
MELPNGDYLIRVMAGDSGFIDSVYRIEVEGVLTVDGAPTAANPWVEGLSVVSVRDGRLTVANGDGALNNKINFIEITSTAYFAPPPTSTPTMVAVPITYTPTPFTSPTPPAAATATSIVLTPQPTSNSQVEIKVNFQQSDTTTPDGQLGDDGSTYRTHSNGYTYGWNADNRPNARERRSSISPDKVHDTLNHMQRNGKFLLGDSSYKWKLPYPDYCRRPGFL